MNIFKSDKAPYAFGLLLTVLGWHVSQFVTEITRTQAVSYSVRIDPVTREVVAEIRNVSRTKSLRNAIFSISCRGGARCLVPIDPEPGTVADYGTIRTFPPNAVRLDRVVNQPHSVAFRSTVAAGGRYAIVARATSPNAPIDFYYLPDANGPLDIFIYRRNTVTGFLVENYLRVLVVSFALCLAALLLSIIFSIRAAWRGTAPAAPDAEGATPASAGDEPAPAPKPITVEKAPASAGNAPAPAPKPRNVGKGTKP